MAHYADILQANVNGFTNSEIDEWRNVVVSIIAKKVNYLII